MNQKFGWTENNCEPKIWVNQNNGEPKTDFYEKVHNLKWFIFGFFIFENGSYLKIFIFNKDQIFFFSFFKMVHIWKNGLYLKMVHIWFFIFLNGSYMKNSLYLKIFIFIKKDRILFFLIFKNGLDLKYVYILRRNKEEKWNKKNEKWKEEKSILLYYQNEENENKKK